MMKNFRYCLHTTKRHVTISTKNNVIHAINSRLFPWKNVINSFSHPHSRSRPTASKDSDPRVRNNTLQKKIFDKINSTYPGSGRGVSLILGPPGCGKTSYVLRAIDQIQKDNNKVIYISEYDKSIKTQNDFHMYLKESLGMPKSDDNPNHYFDRLMRNAFFKGNQTKYCIVLDNMDQLFRINGLYNRFVSYGENSSNSGCYHFIVIINNPEHAINLLSRNPDKTHLMMNPIMFKLTSDSIEKLFESVSPNETVTVNETERMNIIKQSVDNGTIGFANQKRILFRKKHFLNHINIFQNDNINNIQNNEVDIKITEHLPAWSWKDYEFETILNGIKSCRKKLDDDLLDDDLKNSLKLFEK